MLARRRELPATGMPRSYTGRMTTRNWLSVAALGAVFVVLIGQVRSLLADPTAWPPDDFVEYWAAGRLNLTGDNPYSPELLLPLEREAGRDTDVAVMMWNPPWTLAAAMPLGALPARVGQLAWLAVNLAAVGLSARLLWQVFGGRSDRAWLPFAAAFAFMPTYLALHAGQITPLVLLGAALFPWCERRGMPVAAGAAGVLVAIKPHLVYLFWVALAVEATRGRWTVVAGGVAAGLIASAIPLAYNPAVFSQYLAAFRDHPPAEHVSLTLGTLLRLAGGEDRFGLQFLPVLAGLAWFAWYRSRSRGWDWPEALPAVLLASFLTTPYGAWHFDLVLLLVPVIRRAATLAESGRAWPAVAAYLLMNAVMLGLSLAGVYSYWFGWVAPALAIWYVGTGRAEEPSVTRP